MKKILLLIVFSFLGIAVFGQNGTILVNLPTPNPIPVNGSATGTFVLDLKKKFKGRQAIQFITGTPRYPITSITNAPGFSAWDLSDPTNGNAIQIADLEVGVYVFTYVITPVGTVTDDFGTNLMASFGLVVNTSLANVTLPVSLANFEVSREGSLAQLSWSTTMESGAPSFEVNHSTDAKKWKKIGEIKARGGAEILTPYSFSHPNPASGINYYKLKIVDADGTFDQSEIRSLDFGSASLLEVYPNPAAQQVFIRNSDKIASVKLLNSSGRVVREQVGYKPADGISLKQLPEGVYFVQVSRQNGSVSSQKVVVSGL